MKTTKPIVILLALVLLIAAGTQSAEKPAKKEISNTRTASCLVKVTVDEAVLPIDEWAIVYLVRSTGVAGKAAREVLDISPGIVFEIIDIVEVFREDSLLGGLGIPLGTTVPGRRSPSPSRSPTRAPTARTPHPVTTTTTPTRPKPRTPTSPLPRRKPTVTQPLRSATEQTILFHLLVDFSQSDTAEDIKPAAEEFMMALIDNLRSALREAFDQYSAKLNNQLLLADTEAIRAEAKLVNMQKELRAISDSQDLSRSVILTDINGLRRNIQSTKMQKASNQANMKATTNEIAKTEIKIREKVEHDLIKNELQKIVDVQTDSLKRIQALVKQKTASSADVEDVLEKLARARIELAKRREELSKSAGGDRINSLNQQLSDYSIQVTRDEAEIRSLEVQLDVAEDLLKMADVYELFSLKADIVRQSLEETLLWHARLGRNIRSIQPPDVTVIGAE